MLKTIGMLITIIRAHQIISKLYENHKFDIRNDMESMRLVMLMVKITPFSNDRIIREFLKMHTVSVKELFATI
jgi:hypothetical protein